MFSHVVAERGQVYLIIGIEDEITGLNNTDIIDILDHVQQRRGKTNGNLIDKNSVRFREPFDATLGVAVYIRRIEECQQIAGESGEGWSDFQLVRTVQTTMGQSGLYVDAYLIWQRRTQAQKTWVVFKTYSTDMSQKHEYINKLIEENTGFGANSEMELETHEKKLDA